MVCQLDGSQLRAVFVEEDQVVDTLEVLVGHGGLLLHDARRIGLGVLASEVGGFDVIVFGVTRQPRVVHLDTVFYPGLGRGSNGNQAQLHGAKLGRGSATFGPCRQRIFAPCWTNT